MQSLIAKIKAHYVLAEVDKNQLVSMTREYLHKFFSDFNLPLPHFKFAHETNPKALGTTRFKRGDTTTTIVIQKSVVDDAKTLKRVLLHELVHHADLLVNGIDSIEQTFYKGHGPFFLERAKKINTALGEDIVNVKSDSSYVYKDKGTELLVLLNEYAPDKIGWSYTIRPSAKQKEAIKHYLAKGARLVKSTDARFLRGPLIKMYGSVAVPSTPEMVALLRKLYDEAANQ